ncbi:MAG: hypothetical protein K0S07_569 [Chlamydiales bacterium]|jgi:HEAT repeat protein|nr:hypothetical protein [Chlamydiales bacterium]
MKEKSEFKLHELFQADRSLTSSEEAEAAPLDDSFYLVDSEDIAIIMHRDAHFSGSFPLMLEYYLKEGRGAQEDFSLERIEALHALEGSSQKNMASYLLSGMHIDRIAAARQAYKSLKDVYTGDDASPAQAIADLILYEEEDSIELCQKVVAYGSKIVPLLISLLQSNDFSDPLFPGYGEAPMLAALCLGKIKDPQAIKPLFSLLGQDDFIFEEMLLDALTQIGAPAQEFLLKQLLHRPFTADNERAAMALARFAEYPNVYEAAKALFFAEENWAHESFLFYLLLILLNSKSSFASLQERFKALLENPHFPDALKEEIRLYL